ncbi:hypothetical protein M422DRAFT_55731 [Sphaerobolus stellatus SS14]|uniref:Uncharacterized protein n=1 Tax=Sphaerobolus stellatus (strain SS14) TaxID=990650 RepID=A0A0C9UKK6_SPHS4|nr:hypothetical protein M422DRAFT_55731 [Sphaerobolus stellatus SS14]
MIPLNVARKKIQAAAKRRAPLLTDPRAIKSQKIIGGREIAWEEIPEELVPPGSSSNTQVCVSNGSPKGSSSSSRPIEGLSLGDEEEDRFLMMTNGSGFWEEDVETENANGNEEEPEPVSFIDIIEL